MSVRVALAFGWLLAIGASVLSIGISGLVGWQRGGTQTVQVLLAAIGILAVLGAYWLLPLLRAAQTGIVSWLIGALLWLTCLIYAATSHADFFIEAQAQRADHRIAALASEALMTATVPKRNLSAILEEEAAMRTKWMQARFAETACEANCIALNIRQVGLKARVAALEAEGEEARRWHVTQDELRQRKEALRADPVTSSLKRDFGVSPAVANAVTVLPVAVILEGMGAMCWFLVLPGRGRQVIRGLTRSNMAQVTRTEDGNAHELPETGSVPQAVTSLVTSSPVESVTTEFRHDVTPEQRNAQALAARVWTEIQLGRVRPTVSAIRANLRIGQKQARAVRQLIRDRQAAG